MGRLPLEGPHSCLEMKMNKLLSWCWGSAMDLFHQDPCSCPASLAPWSLEEASSLRRSSVGPCLPFLEGDSFSSDLPCLDVLEVWWGPGCLVGEAVTRGCSQEADLAYGGRALGHLGTVET